MVVVKRRFDYCSQQAKFWWLMMNWTLREIMTVLFPMKCDLDLVFNFPTLWMCSLKKSKEMSWLKTDSNGLFQEKSTLPWPMANWKFSWGWGRVGRGPLKSWWDGGLNLKHFCLGSFSTIITGTSNFWHHIEELYTFENKK